MNDDHSNDSNNALNDQINPEVSDMPIFDKEPTTDPSQPAVESSPATELNSPAPDSPFGPPIESLSTGPSFSDSTAAPSSIVPPTPVASGPVNQTPGTQSHTSVSDSPFGVPASPTPPVSEPSPAPSQPSADSSTVAPVIPASSVDSRPKAKKRLLGLWISLAVVVLLLAGVAAVYFFM